MTAPEFYCTDCETMMPVDISGRGACGHGRMIRADLAAVQPAQVRDLISRMDAIQACQVGPSDEWAKATKSGYDQAATDCQRNILRIKPAAIDPQADHRDEVIARLVEAGTNLVGPDCAYDGRKIIITTINHSDAIRLVSDLRAALASAKAVQHG